jgi:hypothetical protein
MSPTPASGAMTAWSSPRYRITLAANLPEDVCRKVNLDYMDMRTFDVRKYANDPDTLVVHNAGRDLYLEKP